MSQLIFDGNDHTIVLFDGSGQVVGAWPANNIVTHDPHYLKFVPNGCHTVATPIRSKRHSGSDDTPNGKFGSYGSVELRPVQGHQHIAVHSGRANVQDKAGHIGINHATEGCIRTTDEAMAVITKTMLVDPLVSVIVQNNHDQHYSSGRK